MAFRLPSHPGKHLEVEVGVLRTHAAHVQREHRPDHRRRDFGIGMDHRRDHAHHLEGVGRAAGTRASEPFGECRPIEAVRLGREPQWKPAVCDFCRQRHVLGALRRQIDRQVRAQRMDGRLQRLAQSRSSWIGKGVVGSRELHPLLAGDDPADDLDVLARPGQRTGIRHPVPPLDDLWPRRTETEDEAAAGQMIHRHGGHGGRRRGSRRHLHDRGAELHPGRSRTPPRQGGQRVRSVGLGGPHRIEAQLLGDRHLLLHPDRRSGAPVADRKTQIHRELLIAGFADHTPVSLAGDCDAG